MNEKRRDFLKTTVALTAVRTLGRHTLAAELGAVTAANAAAAAVRFAVLRTWVFQPQFGTSPGGVPGGTIIDHVVSLTR